MWRISLSCVEKDDALLSEMLCHLVLFGFHGFWQSPLLRLPNVVSRVLNEDGVSEAGDTERV